MKELVITSINLQILIARDNYWHLRGFQDLAADKNPVEV